ncbi:MAG: hypothetical protein IPF84_02025 [Proteobacteria bacterium]|nr:hypothetical protein [Pseudomonadota bacterium]
MNELRWILLVAGALLIAGLYLWGTRTRWQGRNEPEASRRPAVFTGGAKGFETEVAAPQDDDEVDMDMAESVFRTESRVERRIEPGFDQDEVDTLDAPGPLRVDFDDESDFESPAIGRREPDPVLDSNRFHPDTAAGTAVARRADAERARPRRSSRRRPCPAWRRRRHQNVRRRYSRFV